MFDLENGYMYLHKDYFSESSVKYILSQKYGAECLVIWQMLCIDTALQNKNYGTLCYKIGKKVIPYNLDDIRRICKFFNEAVIQHSIDLLRELEIIHKENNVWVIEAYDELDDECDENG